MIRAEFFHFPASTFSLAGEEGEKQLGGSDPDGATEQLLKRFETQLFSLDVSAYREDLIGKLPMQGFAMSRFPAIQFPEHGFCFPLVTAFLRGVFAFDGPSPLIGTVGIVGTALAVLFPP